MNYYISKKTFKELIKKCSIVLNEKFKDRELTATEVVNELKELKVTHKSLLLFDDIWFHHEDNKITFDYHMFDKITTVNVKSFTQCKINNTSAF